jgi:hypothetical protein
MKVALLQVFPPAKENGCFNHSASVALAEISKIAKDSCQRDTGFEQLGDYAWLCRVETSLSAISDVIHFANQGNFAYRIAFLNEKLDWITHKESQ